MKTQILLAAAAAVMLGTPVLAGETQVQVSKEVVAPPAPVYGTGFYLGLQAGINAHQDSGNEEFSIGGTSVTLDTESDVGFVGGLKVGYVFGRGLVRGAVEADLYYNGVGTDVEADIGAGSNFDSSADIHSGAFIANFLVRFAFDRFQPYVGGGVGGYYAEANNAQIRVNGSTHDVEGGNDSGFAWQLIGGADYYLNETLSIFAEYKFLNYEEATFTGDTFEQHLVVLGVRIHF